MIFFTFDFTDFPTFHHDLFPHLCVGAYLTMWYTMYILHIFYDQAQERE